MKNRQQAIMDLVNQSGEVSISQLREIFPNVSEVTLRKDLRSLDEAKKLVRIHGGAKSIQGIVGGDNNFSVRKQLHQEEKSLIGRKAASLIVPGASVYISSGTTCTELAKALPAVPLYLFTDGVMVGVEVPPHPDIQVEFLGGVLNRNLMRLQGPAVISAMQELRFDISFIGTPGFHPNYGFACTTPMIAATLSKAIEQSEKTAILMDSSKVNYMHTPRNIPLRAIDYVISDGDLPAEIVQLMEENGITVL
nr:DeoR/GlpR family DNA-binding transcription regulator [uncultured Dysosmobacter sp.]